MYGSGVKPLKGGETRWINHKLRAMGRLLEKFGLYVRHLKDSASSSKNSTACATVQGKKWWTPKFLFVLHFSQTF